MHKSKPTAIFAILIINSMAIAGCLVNDISYDGYTSFVVVNNYNETIYSIVINILDPGYHFSGYVLSNKKFSKGKSKVQYLDKTEKAFNAEVIVWFGSEYDIKEYRFAPGETTFITLNENGILE